MTDAIASTLTGIQQTLLALAADIAAVRRVMATKDDVAAVRDVMATKDDVAAGLAAVRDVMATKDDVAAGLAAVRDVMATKDDVAAVRDDLRDRMLRGFTDLAGRIDHVRAVAVQANDRVDHLLALVGPPLLAHGQRLDRLEAAVDELRRRR